MNCFADASPLHQRSMNSQKLHGSGPTTYDREREMDDRHRALQQREEMARRDQERERERERDRERDRERESGDRYQSTTHHSSAGSIPIHQPVASRIPGAIHSPGGLLANHNGNPQIPLGASSGGPLATFGGPLQNEHGRPVQHGGQANANPQHPMFAPMPHTAAPPSSSQQAAASGVAAVFGGPLQQEGQRGAQQGAPFPGAAASAAHQIPGGITQGQQPILNVSLCDVIVSFAIVIWQVAVQESNNYRLFARGFQPVGFELAMRQAAR